MNSIEPLQVSTYFFIYEIRFRSLSLQSKQIQLNHYKFQLSIWLMK